jgi:hypothetical protein
VATVAALALAWAGLTTGVEVAAAEGAGVAHPPAFAGPVAYLGVRLDNAQLADGQVRADLAAIDATAVVDEQTALADPTAVRVLVAAGVDVESGGHGDGPGVNGALSRPSLWDRANGDAQAGQELSALTGETARVVVPGRRVNAWDLIDCSHDHDTLVRPDQEIAATTGAPLAFSARHIYLVMGLGASPAQLAATLARVASGLESAGLTGQPLSTLE